MPYLILYYQKATPLGDNYVLVMAPAVVMASVVTAFWGKVYDKKGFDYSHAFVFAWLCAGYVILFFSKDTVLVFIGSLFMMSGYLAGMAVFGAKIRDLTPVGKAGMFQGVRIFSQVFVPGIIGPKVGAWILRNADKIENSDGTYSFIPNENIFIGALVAAVVAMAVLLACNKLRKSKT